MELTTPPTQRGCAGRKEKEMLKIKIHADNGEMSEDLIYEAEELGNNSGYGSGQYIILKAKGRMPICVDCRYMKGYSLEKAAKDYLNGYYGENLKSIEVIK